MNRLLDGFGEVSGLLAEFGEVSGLLVVLGVVSRFWTGLLIELWSLNRLVS